MNNLSEIITEITKGEEAKEEIAKIKKILNNDGTTSVIDQVTYLQENTSVNNINKLAERLSKLSKTLADIESGCEDMERSIDDAKNTLDEYNSYNCWSDDIQQLYSQIYELKDDVADKDSELNDDRPQTQVIQERIAKENEQMTDNPTQQQ